MNREGHVMRKIYYHPFFFPIMVARFVSRSCKCHDIHCTQETTMLLLKAQPWDPLKNISPAYKEPKVNHDLSSCVTAMEQGHFFFLALLVESNPSNSISWMVNGKGGLWKLRFELSEIK